ncbi:MAG: IS91 family transposase [Chloroflexia bacterium]|nr:IS91 family transposase [Chloroflexia bacterium]
MMAIKPRYEVAEIIDNYRDVLEGAGKLTAHKKKVFTNLSQCRTAALGYHKDKCDNPDCGHIQISYNSCRDRHCPKCNGIKREKWVRMREQDLLPIKYYHVVFTLPDKVNHLFIEQPVLLYNLLFSSAWETIKKFGSDHKYLGAKTGMTSILHTWGQNIAFHPHIHCIVPAGGITENNKWKHSQNEGKYLFPVKALSKVFRGIFTDGLIDLEAKGKIHLEIPFDAKKKYLHPLYEKKWVVYAKLPMHNAKQVVDYIGRYSHRIAISNHRIKEVKDGRVKFSCFNYKTSKMGEVNLTAEEFLQRFELHILPSHFMKIRHYGILSSRNKATALDCARSSLNVQKPASRKNIPWQELFEQLYGRKPHICPICMKGTMVVIESNYPKNRGSPQVKLQPNYDFLKQ